MCTDNNKLNGIRALLIALFTCIYQTALANDTQRILLFTKTAGFYHGSIPFAVSAIRTGAEANGYIVDDSDDASVINEANLANYDAVVFVMTSGNILNNSQQIAFENFIRAGNGYVGMHSASDTEYDWPWYGDLVGAYFSSHPPVQQANIIIEDGSHPSMQGLSSPWVRTDEWYNFQPNPRANVNVLATLDESSYTGGNMGTDHPIIWYHEFDGGRAWYTGGGHTVESHSDPLFVNHVLGGIAYAAGETQIVDTDSDGVSDSNDNCQLVANSSQLDTDSDGFGNMCDADINNDCVINFQDFSFITASFLSTDRDADLNGDGIVNFFDISLFVGQFLNPPGPSAFTNCP